MDYCDAQTTRVLQHSLAAIHIAKLQYHLVDSSTTPELLSKIDLCETLLREIHTIRLSLEEQRILRRRLGDGRASDVSGAEADLVQRSRKYF